MIWVLATGDGLIQGTFYVQSTRCPDIRAGLDAVLFAGGPWRTSACGASTVTSGTTVTLNNVTTGETKLWSISAIGTHTDTMLDVPLADIVFPFAMLVAFAIGAVLGNRLV